MEGKRLEGWKVGRMGEETSLPLFHIFTLPSFQSHSSIPCVLCLIALSNELTDLSYNTR
jgi:hypothetical protein